jgi:hypothetical protein
MLLVSIGSAVLGGIVPGAHERSPTSKVTKKWLRLDARVADSAVLAGQAVPAGTVGGCADRHYPDRLFDRWLNRV